MSLLPLLMNLNWDKYDPWQFNRQHRVRTDLEREIIPPEIKRNSLQRRQLKGSRIDLGKSTIGKDGFQVLIEVQQFHPNEVTVKTVDNTIIVEAKHEERHDDEGTISRQFIRKYQLPKGYDIKDVISIMSSDGVLTIKATPPQKSGSGNERIVQIQHTGPAHLHFKENPAKEPDNKKK